MQREARSCLREVSVLVLVLALVALTARSVLATIGGGPKKRGALMLMSERELVQAYQLAPEGQTAGPTFEILYRFVDDGVDPVRSDLARLLVQGLLGGSTPAFRARCALALGTPLRHGSPEALRALTTSLLTDQAVPPRLAASIVLRRSGAGIPAAAQALAAAAENDPDKSVRDRAAGRPFSGPYPRDPAQPSPVLRPVPPGASPTPLLDRDGWWLAWVRPAAESAGARVEWDQEQRACALLTEHGVRVRLAEGSNLAQVNVETLPLATAPVIIDGRMFVPLGFLAQALNFEFSVDSEAGVAYIWPATDSGESAPATTERPAQPTG